MLFFKCVRPLFTIIAIMISALTSILRFIIRTTLFIGFLLLILFPVLMLVNFHRRRGTKEGGIRADEIGARLSSWMVWFFGIRVRVRGTPAEAPVLIAANHTSWLDIPVLHTARAMGFVSKAEVDQWPVFSFIARTGGTIFHHRGSHDSASDVADLMIQRLKQGRCVAIFPEGGIKPGHSVRVFHARMFRAAVDAECEVQPVMLRYMRDGRRDYDVGFRKGESMLVNFVRMLAQPRTEADINFLPPMDATGQPRRILADSARAAVIESYESDQ
jgi:1-acyl-sn-glycerol-3-phosphate acyltransferase